MIFLMWCNEFIYYEGYDMLCYFLDFILFVGNCFYKFWYMVFKYLKKNLISYESSEIESRNYYVSKFNGLGI